MATQYFMYILSDEEHYSSFRRDDLHTFLVPLLLDLLHYPYSCPQILLKGPVQWERSKLPSLLANFCNM